MLDTADAEDNAITKYETMDVMWAYGPVSGGVAGVHEAKGTV